MTVPASAGAAKAPAHPPENPSLSPYQASLPYVRGHDSAGQWDLFTAKPGEIPELGPDERFAELDPSQLQLFDAPGVSKGAGWVRQRDGRRPDGVPWAQLEIWRVFRDRFRGKPWSALDCERRDAVLRQTWGASEVGGARGKHPWLRCDGIVDVWGEWMPLPRNARTREMLEVIVDAFASGAGGVVQSRADWAAFLTCSPSSVYRSQQELARLGLVELVQLWEPAPGGVGSQRGMLLVRLAGRFAAHVGVAALAAPGRAVPRRSGLTKDKARAMAGALSGRARRRRFDLSGSLYRGNRKISGAISRRALLKRSNRPDSPPLTGLRRTPPVPGGAGVPPDPIDRSSLRSRTTVAERPTKPPKKRRRPTSPATTTKPATNIRPEGEAFRAPALDAAELAAIVARRSAERPEPALPLDTIGALFVADPDRGFAELARRWAT